MPPLKLLSGTEEQPTRDTIAKRLLESPDTYGSIAMILFVDLCSSAADEKGTAGNIVAGPDDDSPLAWHPTTIRMELEERTGAKIHESVFSRLMACISIATNDQFFSDVPTFIDFCNILNGDDFDPNVFDPADVDECAWGVTEAILIAPPTRDNPEPFSEEVRAYIGYVLSQEGFLSAPDVLQVALMDEWHGSGQSDFSDDPEMFGMMYETQQSRTKDVEDMIRQGLTQWKAQLHSLKLDNGSAENFLGPNSR